MKFRDIQICFLIYTVSSRRDRHLQLRVHYCCSAVNQQLTCGGSEDLRGQLYSLFLRSNAANLNEHCQWLIEENATFEDKGLAKVNAAGKVVANCFRE